MMAPAQLTPWTTAGPAKWPALPEEMTVSTLMQIETCPRRWALASAEYPELWNGRGYPPRVTLGALAGIVVHLVVETVTRELVRASCQTAHDSTAVQVMKTLGGYSCVVQGCIDRVIARCAENPRAARFLEHAALSLRAQVPDFRARAQALLGRVRLSSFGGTVGTRVARARAPLPNGVFPEIELRAEQIGWKGRADLLVLSEETSEIIDFKTGKEDEAHRFQITVYALLWSRDSELNPNQRLVDTLTLAYSSRDVRVAAPSTTQLNALERDLVARRAAARLAASTRPPEARPTVENCRFCEVRQLCDAYWDPAIGSTPRDSWDEPGLVDLEITIVERHGAASWDGIVSDARYRSRGRRIVVRTPNGSLDSNRGDRLRLLDVFLLPPDNPAAPLVLTMNAASEAFRVL